MTAVATCPWAAAITGADTGTRHGMADPPDEPTSWDIDRWQDDYEKHREWDR